MAYMFKIQCAICSKDEDCSIMYVDEGRKLAVHQDCLLYSSGFSEPEECYDKTQDRRFHVPAVLNEVNRGRKLTCFFCRKKGATVGCEGKACRRSYHYLCALKDEASKHTDEKQGIYRVYCQKHDPHRTTSVNVGVQFLRTCKRVGLLDKIFNKMTDALHLAQEKLKDDNTPEAEFEKTVLSLFKCGLFEHILANAHSETQGKIQELLETRDRLDTEIAVVDSQIQVLKDLKEILPVSEDASSSTCD